MKSTRFSFGSAAAFLGALLIVVSLSFSLASCKTADDDNPLPQGIEELSADSPLIGNGKIRTVLFTKFHKLNFLITAKTTIHTQEKILSFQNQQIIPATFTFNIHALPRKTGIIQQTKQKLLMLENGTQFLSKN